MDQTVGTWILGIVLVLIQFTLTTVLGLIIKKHWDKKEAEKKELEELRAHNQEEQENTRCKKMEEAVHKEIVDMEDRFNAKSDKRYTELKEDIGLVKEGLQKDLYIDLVRIYDDLVAKFNRKGFITREEKRDFDALYWSYHKLGKNGVADGMHDEVMAMTTNPKGE